MAKFDKNNKNCSFLHVINILDNESVKLYLGFKIEKKVLGKMLKTFSRRIGRQERGEVPTS